MTPSKGPKALRQCNLLSAQSQKGQNSYFPPTHSQKYLGWPSFQKCKSPMLISGTGRKISKKKQDFCGKFPEQSISPQNRDCYHTSTFHLLHLHFICCAIIPRPAPFSDPSRLSAPELLFAFFPHDGAAGVWAAPECSSSCSPQECFFAAALKPHQLLR